MGFLSKAASRVAVPLAIRAASQAARHSRALPSKTLSDS